MYSLRVKFIIKIRLKIWRQFNKFCPSCINLKFMAYHHSVPLVQQVLPCRRCLPVQSFCWVVFETLIRLWLQKFLQITIINWDHCKNRPQYLFPSYLFPVRYLLTFPLNRHYAPLNQRWNCVTIEKKGQVIFWWNISKFKMIYLHSLFSYH